jgi:tetratricopeptide (TPR) repeat protein
VNDPVVRRFLAALLLVALVILAWSNGLHGEFTYDDKVEVIGNRTVRFLQEWRSVIAYNLSRPLLILSYAANWEYAGPEPFSWHLVDVAIQVINGCLALWLGEAIARQLGFEKPLRFGLISAGIWVLHPLSTEAVSYVTGRSEQLVATFYLLACQRWLVWLEKQDRWAWAQAWLVFLLAAFTKEVAATIPVAFLLLELQVARRGHLRQIRWLAYLPAVLMLAALAGLRFWLYGAVTTALEPQRPWDVHIWTQFEVTWRYVGLWLVPVGQSIFHDYPETVLTWRSGAAAAGLVALTGLAWHRRQRGPLLALAWFWFLLVLLPAAAIPLKETMAEHRVYLSVLGLAWVVAAALQRLSPPRSSLVAAALVSVCIFATQGRNRVWATEIAVWSEAVDHNQESAEAWYGLGDAHRIAGNLQDSAKAYKRAIALDDSMLDAWTNLGIVLFQTGQFQAAEKSWKQALRRSPTYCKAHNNLALHYARRDRVELAVREFRTSLQYCPEDLTAFYFLGRLYEEKLGELDRAVEQYQAILTIDDASSYAEDARQRILNLTW